MGEGSKDHGDDTENEERRKRKQIGKRQRLKKSTRIRDAVRGTVDSRMKWK